MSVETVNHKFVKLCVLLESEEKKRRVLGLKEILQILESPPSESEIIELWNAVNKSLHKILTDAAEICRDNVLEIFQLFIANLTPHDNYILYLLPILSRRLGSQELIESSEEVRLKCVTLLKLLILKYKHLLASYIDDLIKILIRTISDNYPLVKRESCACVSEFAKNLSRHFYAHSEKFVTPILGNFSHQHYRVRIASIKSIGDLIQYGNSKCIENVATPLAERLFDQNGLIRTAVIEVAGHWLLNLKDRYSWWHKILPLLLSGLHDELQELREKAESLWNAVGELYITENQNDEKLKDKMDFLIKAPHHYPNIARPNLGCRIIAQQTFSKLINGINLELGDWMADIRVRSAQLLCVFILNIEEDVTQHIEKLLPSMYRACNDDDIRVVENIEKAAEYLGYFVHPEIYCRLILPTLEESPSVGHLRVFSAILRSSEYSTLLPSLEKIGKFMQQSYICQSKKTAYQQQVFSCCDSLISVCKEDCKIISKDLFIVTFTVLSMAKEHTIELKAKELLNTIAHINGFDNMESLYYEYIEGFNSLFSNSKSWSIYNPESQIFCACLSYVKTVLNFNMNIMLPILKQTMANDADPALRLKHFILLSEYFNQGSLHEIIDLNYCYQFLENCIFPALIWSAGKTAEAIRTAAVCCLCAFLEKYKADCLLEKDQCLSEKNIPSALDKIIPTLISLADDNSKKSRLYSLKALYLIVCIRKRSCNITEEFIHKMYPVLLKRLDDGCDNIRLASMEVLVKVWSSIPEDYNLHFNKAHVDTLYTTTIIYLDEPESEFQKYILDSLKELAKVHPELLYEKLHNCKTNFRNQKGMEILLEHCQYILENNLSPDNMSNNA
nr:dynein assembly factor 5, axonemal isoform X1 [Megalopta genalis]